MGMMKGGAAAFLVAFAGPLFPRAFKKGLPKHALSPTTCCLAGPSAGVINHRVGLPPQKTPTSTSIHLCRSCHAEVAAAVGYLLPHLPRRIT